MQLNHKESEPREVSAWARETGDEARRDRVVAAGKDDRRRGGGALRRVCCKVPAACDNQVDPTADEFGGQRRQPIILTLRPAVLDCHVLALDITSLFEALSERGHVCCKGSWRSTAEIANHRQLGLLGSDGERPRGSPADDGCGRDASCLVPPAQIRTCSFPAYGSHLGCVTAKRLSGQGWRIRGLGSQSSISLSIRTLVRSAF